MAKYAFNNDAQNLSDAMGVSNQRWEELSAAAQKTATAALFTDESISNYGRALEMLINEAQPVGEVEAMALGYIFGKGCEKAKRLVERLNEAIETYK